MSTIVEEHESDLVHQDLAELLALPQAAYSASADAPLETTTAQLEFCPFHPDATM